MVISNYRGRAWPPELRYPSKEGGCQLKPGPFDSVILQVVQGQEYSSLPLLLFDLPILKQAGVKVARRPHKPKDHARFVGTATIRLKVFIKYS